MNKRFLPAIACATIIFYLSTTGSINMPQSLTDLFSMDKVGHFIAYGFLTYFLLFGFIFTKKSDDQVNPKWKKKRVYIALIISILYGIGLEVIQYVFFPRRYFEYYDIIANIIGSITGLFLYNFFNKKS